MKIRPVGAELFMLTDRQTDRQTYITKLRVAVCAILRTRLKSSAHYAKLMGCYNYDHNNKNNNNNNNNNFKTCKQPLYFTHIFTTSEQGTNWHDEPQQSYKLTLNGRRMHAL